MSRWNGESYMKGIRYTDEFKFEAVKQITERSHDVADIAQRLGVSTKSLYKWRHEVELRKRPAVSADVVALKQEVARLNAEMKIVWVELPHSIDFVQLSREWRVQLAIIST